MTWDILQGDCVDLMHTMDACSVDAIVTDPPYHLSFMGREWDRADGVAIDAAFGHWLAGFIDGEGCFHVHRKPQDTFDCQFSITLRGDDMPILERCQRETGLGTLALRRPDGFHPKARWTISSKAQCVALRDLLRAFPLRAKKARDFEAWSEALDAWLAHQRGEWGDMEEARVRLMSLRDYEEGGVKIDPSQLWHFRWAREALRVLKPGGHLLAFGGTRTYHRLVCAVEDAGFEIRDTIAWMYGSGFPKSLDVSKQIDKQAGAEREELAPSPRHGGGIVGNGSSYELPPEPHMLTAPATPEAEQWDGWGTALKPAHEPIVVARKPLTGTVAKNVLEHGTGALNIDGCRIEGTTQVNTYNGRGPFGKSQVGREYESKMVEGRWPANVIVDEQAADTLDEQTADLKGAVSFSRRGGNGAMFDPGDQELQPGYGDSGGASRFFYVAKASRAERNAGLDGFEEREASERHAYSGLPDQRMEHEQTRNSSRNHHPTVKPVDLMRHLVRLVTPPNGLVLDPFAGSGTTGVAAVLEGFRFVGLERDAEYAAIARARMGWWAEHGHDALRIVSERDKAEAERESYAAAGQMNLLSMRDDTD